MSDDDRDNNMQVMESAEKRAHHNALERKRRDHIKDSFINLRESVPSLQGEKVASRAHILKKAADYIQFMHRKNDSHQQDIDDLKRQNSLLESQIRTLEKTKETGNFAMESSEIDYGVEAFDDDDDDDDDDESVDENDNDEDDDDSIDFDNQDAGIPHSYRGQHLPKRKKKIVYCA